MLVPAGRVAVAVVVAQLVQAPVGAKASWVTTTPLTERFIGRLAVEPLANRMVSVTDPACARTTVHSTRLPTWLNVLQYPVPEKPGWSESMVPSQVAFSASYRMAEDSGSTSRKSTFGPPLAVTRIALLPAFNVTVVVVLAQVSQLPVGAKTNSPAASVPLTAMLIGRLAVDPLAYRNVSRYRPVVCAGTCHCTKLPDTLL